MRFLSIVSLMSLFVFVMCQFVVAASYSEVDTNFMVMGASGSNSSPSFLGTYGDFIVAAVIVLIVVLIYLGGAKSIKKVGKKRKK
jgi:hypothetical protein